MIAVGSEADVPVGPDDKKGISPIPNCSAAVGVTRAYGL